MTRQGTFDIVMRHLHRQGKKALAPSGLSCMYRTADGLTCAAGCLIPAADYVHAMDFCGGVAVNNHVRAVLRRDDHELDLVTRLQQLHDMYEPREWKEQAARIANDFGLLYTPEAA